MTTTPQTPGGPRGLRGQLAFTGFGRDPLGFVERLVRDYPGGAARLPMPGGALVYLTDPEAIGAVLLDRDRVFTKDWTTRALEPVLGAGLFTSEGDFWKRQRNLVAPALHRKQIAAYVEIAARRAAAWADGLGEGERDVKPDFTRLTMEIVAEALFGANLSTGFGDAAQRVAAALEEALRAFETLIYSWRRFVPAEWDQPVRRRLADASRALDAVVVEIIAKKRAAAAPGEDLLTRLLDARDEGGAGMTDRQLRDELVTMLLAGHETTAMALSFATWFLAAAPDVAAKIADEAGPSPLATLDDVARLSTATAAFKETLRLRPPVWLFGREAQRDVVAGAWKLAKGEQVLVTPWLMHHDARWFEDPRTFKPARWTPAFEDALPRHVYLPFGGGQRTCAGVHFALMEGAVILATLCRRATFTRVDPGELELSPAITLRPKGGVRLRFARRSLG
jgi:cytochrome P450